MQTGERNLNLDKWEAQGWFFTVLQLCPKDGPQSRRLKTLIERLPPKKKKKEKKERRLPPVWPEKLRKGPGKSLPTSRLADRNPREKKAGGKCLLILAMKTSLALGRPLKSIDMRQSKNLKWDQLGRTFFFSPLSCSGSGWNRQTTRLQEITVNMTWRTYVYER